MAAATPVAVDSLAHRRHHRQRLLRGQRYRRSLQGGRPYAQVVTGDLPIAANKTVRAHGSGS